MRIPAAGLLALAFVPAAAVAATQDCAGPLVQQPLPLPATAVAPVAAELGSRTSQLGMPSGVLASAPDVSQSVDHVLLRLRIANCRESAKAMPVVATTAAATAVAAAAANPDDPAAYKPRTEYDNKPYRFDMTQNGKRMTADDFDAWLKANGYSAGRRVDTSQPAADAPAAAPSSPTK